MHERILIRGVNWVGDAVMTMPAIASVRRAYPDAEITLLVKPWVAPLFELDPSVDKVIVYDEHHRGFAGKFRLAKELKSRGFTKAILLQNAFDAAAAAFLAGIPERIGYSRDARGFMLTKPVPYHKEDRVLHHVEYYLSLLRNSGIEAQESAPWIHLSLEERTSARHRLSALPRPVVGINPGASFGSSKRWLPERFADVAREVVESMGGSVVVFGGPKETSIAHEITAPLVDHVKSGRVMDLAGKTSLRELAALISECDVVVSNDSGPMHVAYAVRTPLVALFGSTSPELTGPPPSPGSIVIKKPLSCAPCFERSCPKKKGLPCMEAIGAQEVIDAVRSLLPQRRAVFFDRDGTLCDDAHYLSDWKDFKPFPDLDVLQALKAQGLMLIGISNQSGIARGRVEEGFTRSINAFYMERHGFDDFYYCPHMPKAGCPCRKPSPEMAHRARYLYRIDLKNSFMVGDKDVDMTFAKAIGAMAIFMDTGKEPPSPNADAVAQSLTQGARIILSKL